MPIKKKNTGKIRVCIDFRNLNRATPKYEYPMPIADMLINDASGHRVIVFLMVMQDITKSSWAKKICLKLPLGVSVLYDYLSGLS